METTPAAGVQRIWRLRKRQHQIDAELRDEGSSGAVVRFFYDGKVAFVRWWPTRREADGSVREKRDELERAGWIEHW